MQLSIGPARAAATLPPYSGTRVSTGRGGVGARPNLGRIAVWRQTFGWRVGMPVWTGGRQSLPMCTPRCYKRS